MHNPAQPVREVEVGGRKYRLHYDHKDFVNAEHALRKQGIEVRLLGPRAGEFWEDLLSAIEGEEAAKIRQQAGVAEDVPIIDYDFWKISVLLYVGLFRSIRGLSFDAAQDLLNGTPEHFGQMNAAVIAGVTAAMSSYIKTAPPEEAPEERPLATANGGASESPAPAPSESANANSGE